MRLKITSITFVLWIFAFGQSVSAQGVSDIIRRLDSLEKRFEQLEANQEETLDRLKEGLSGTTPGGGGGRSEILKSLNTLESGIEELGNQMEKAQQDLRALHEETGALRTIDDMHRSIGVLEQKIETIAVSHAPGEAAPGVDRGQEKRGTPEIGLDAAFVSAYVWRGIVLTDDPVLQPSVTAGYGNMSLNVWSNMDLTDVNGNQSEVNELDFTLDYAFDLAAANMSAGVVRYTFPNTGYASTTEMYLSLGSEKTGGAALTVYQDVGEVEGSYVSLSSETAVHVMDRFDVEIYGALGWGSGKHNGFYYGSGHGAVSDVLVHVSVPFEIGGYLSIAPSVSFSSIVNNRLRDAVHASGRGKDNLDFGLAASRAF